MIWWAAYCPSAAPQLMNSRTPPRAVLALATDFRSRRASPNDPETERNWWNLTQGGVTDAHRTVDQAEG
jgi:hypothetical protein